MGEKQRNVSALKQVAAINTDYVRSIERQENRKKAKKVRLFRRLAVFGIMSLALVGFLITTLINSNQTLEEKQLQKEKVTEELAKVQEEQEMLKLQISKLNDDEYIGKLLRKEYFLSEEGEIIFTLPDPKEK
ncbi:FtsB family cell division protein [Psychrobacillus lasiicapitis]|uniref:Septum formation initiator family protein n=1 Tax=Psychrobacillus lasiicapitis TaxID=1636719 RepID=A0A544SSU6_9BACI|nr:septum formation initiator family protein [Psychrobacillus lasiicapitis]TQR08292.1 septum formation initiator family protein [Psychrobacillus lasiicapitis]GGA48484.1 cell division protein DIVIC [Psychrobacillus lasiicapitis]